jgi:hypothetical protein
VLQPNGRLQFEFAASRRGADADADGSATASEGDSTARGKPTAFKKAWNSGGKWKPKSSAAKGKGKPWTRWPRKQASAKRGGSDADSTED